MSGGPGTVQGRRAATTGAATMGDGLASWLDPGRNSPETDFCAGEDTKSKIGNEGRIPPGDPYATLVAIFGDSKRARRHYCPGGGRMWMRGGAMEAIWGLLIGGSLAGVRVSFLAGARSSDFGPMLVPVFWPKTSLMWTP